MHVTRVSSNPFITPDMPGLEGEKGANINGPSVIRVPTWIENPLGKYYMYFAHHGGTYIRLAYADHPEGPWTVHAPGVLDLEQCPGTHHIASPDMLVLEEDHTIRMYFHSYDPERSQVSYVAESTDGLTFTCVPDILGPFYFRVFRYENAWYALAKDTNIGGVICRSADGLTSFEEGPAVMPMLRHTAVYVRGETAYVFFSRAGDCPERILLSTIDLSGDWRQWDFSEPVDVLRPETTYEGADCPLEKSEWGPVAGRVNQLRDPAVFIDQDETMYLYYSIAGESGIAAAVVSDL